MYKIIVAIIRHERLEKVISALTKNTISEAPRLLVGASM